MGASDRQPGCTEWHGSNARTSAKFDLSRWHVACVTRSMRRTVAFSLLAFGVTTYVFAACTNTEPQSGFPDSGVDGGNVPNQFAEGGFSEGGNEPGDAQPTLVCGNGVKNEATELCDDGNTKSGDGCTDNYRVEPGYTCPTPGRPCVALECGDGLLAGDEFCDDGNKADGDGCSAACKIEDGFKCTTPGQPCTRTTCGDNVKEGVEQCDDGNLEPFDGCDPACKVEPKCTGGTCTSVCGDGLKFPGEACDDGNTRGGDGCSPTCTLEAGFECTHAKAAPPATKDLWVAYRDFKAAASAGGHPDFLAANFTNPAINVIAQGLVKPLLDSGGRPEFLSRRGTGALDIIQDATSFSQWFRDTPFSKKVVSTLRLNKQPDDTYVFDDGAFFPLDTAANAWPERQADFGGNMRNFLFTSEVRIPFTYKGGETLTFRGDDDVWVFVNGHLAVDIGGVKEAQTGSITLGPAQATAFGLTVGGFYEFAVFQAERNPTASSYRLTLSDFDRVLSTCKSVCGDGIKTPDELCDEGRERNTGGYGRCTADCGRGPFCGDGIVQSPQEQCDSTPGCTADCRRQENAPR